MHNPAGIVVVAVESRNGQRWLCGMAARGAGSPTDPAATEGVAESRHNDTAYSTAGQYAIVCLCLCRRLSLPSASHNAVSIYHYNYHYRLVIIITKAVPSLLILWVLLIVSLQYSKASRYDSLAIRVHCSTRLFANKLS